MVSKNVTLKINKQIYERYREYCKDRGLIISKQFENFIKEELKRNKIWCKNGFNNKKNYRV